jgi:tRNA dimethylallyltransferase
MDKLLVITGPTAVGKSAVALAVAKHIGGEIISADSVQVYRGLDIGAAKPSQVEREVVPHHLLDIVDPGENYTVAQYQTDAAAAITEIHSRGKLPILVGGTGLYIRAVVMGYAFSESGVDEELRQRLRTIAEDEGPEALHSRLAAVDPLSAEKLHPNDVRRVIRALEVYENSKNSITRQIELTTEHVAYDTKMFGITMPRDCLYRQIELRVDQMMDGGLVDEVRSLLKAGVPPQAKALQSLGYKQIVGFLQEEYTLDEAVLLIKRDTRRFAKRQLTWFRREQEITWLNIFEYGSSEAVAENISYNLAGYY